MRKFQRKVADRLDRAITYGLVFSLTMTGTMILGSIIGAAMGKKLKWVDIEK